MPRRWVFPLLLALAAPSGFGGSATGSFAIELQLQTAGAAPPARSPGGASAPEFQGDRGLTTCTSASGASSVQVRCTDPTFVQISEGAGMVGGPRGPHASQDACGQLAAVPGLTCVSYAGRAVEHQANEGVALLPADTALRLEKPGAPAGPGALYEIRRRDSLSTLVAVQTIDPDSRTVELLVTF